jgi:hypothetical protein
MKKMFLVLVLSFFCFSVTYATASETCKKQASIFNDGTGDNRSKKRGGNYAAIKLNSLRDTQTIKINPVSGTFQYVTLHARYNGGYWTTIYKGSNKSFPVGQVLGAYINDKNCTHVNISVNGAHEKYEPIACTAEILVCGQLSDTKKTDCTAISVVFNDGKGNNRTKKLGGNYAAIKLDTLKENQTLQINPVSGTFQYVT